MRTLKYLKQGQNEAGDCGSPSDDLPDWMDMERFRRGQNLFIRHLAPMGMALHFSLVTGFSIINLLKPLVYTNQSNTPEKAIKRYFHTFMHLALWHIGDVWDTSSKAHKSVLAVRGMHKNVGKAMNNELKDKLYVSQYDMALVQCGFFAAAVCYPNEAGLCVTDEELGDYVFFWRGIGYLLGLDDKYNVCSGSLEEARSLAKEIEEELLLPALKDPPSDFEMMANAYVDGVNMPTLMPINSVKSMVAYSYLIMGLPVPPLDWADTLRFWHFRWYRFMVRWCPGFAWLLGKLALMGFERNQEKLWISAKELRVKELGTISTMAFWVGKLRVRFRLQSLFQIFSTASPKDA